MKKLANFAVFLVAFFVTLIVVGCCVYNYQISSVSKSTEIQEFTVNQGSTYMTIAKELKDKKLIRSPFFYKLYVKIFKPDAVEACTYQLSPNMNVKKIISELETSCTENKDVINVTIPEGKTMETVASLMEKATNNSKSELLKVWDSKEFINEVISKYWFVTKDVLKDGLRHPLEGYLFPSTYEFTSKDVDAKYIAYKMLDQMDVVLTKYKEKISKSGYTTHQLLTMASIVEYEAILDEDRANVAGVFYNRLADGWKLESCATLGYAINDWKLTYSLSDMGTDSLYNTYYYKGLPIGPGGMAGEASIKAAINPNENDYFFFMANVCDKTSEKTYFSKTLAEHEANVSKYLTCF